MLGRLGYYISSIPTLLAGLRNWPEVVVRSAGILGAKHWVVTLRDGSRFHVRSAMDVWVVKETCLDRQYERESVQIENGWTVLDIGAALGDFSICVARRNPNCLVYAYEPFPESFDLLQLNIKLNKIQNVRAFPYAVGARDGAAFLRVSSKEAVRHSTVTGQVDGKNAVAVEAVSLNEVFVQNGIVTCDYLKADCEGAEYDILLNAGAAVLNRIRYICIEYHDGVTPFSHDDLLRHLKNNGFDVKSTRNPVHSGLGFLYAANRGLPGHSSTCHSSAPRAKGPPAE